MIRRQFFGWLGKISVALGLGYLAVNADELDEELRQNIPTPAIRNHRIRMNGRACHDYRMVSGDRSMILDEEIFR